MRSSVLFLDNMRFHAFHGVMENERIVGGEYAVSLRIEYDFSAAQLTDDLQDAIDYGNVYALVAREMRTPSKLIEHLARRIQDAVLRAYPTIQSMETSVSKFHPPFEGEMDRAVVTIAYER